MVGITLTKVVNKIVVFEFDETLKATAIAYICKIKHFMKIYRYVSNQVLYPEG